MHSSVSLSVFCHTLTGLEMMTTEEQSGSAILSSDRRTRIHANVRTSEADSNVQHPSDDGITHGKLVYVPAV
jgi:hypothetical protein